MVSMNTIPSLDYIISARHYAESMGCQTALERIQKMREEYHMRKRVILPMQQDKYAADPVAGFIENGQWIARCECGGCEFVDPDDGVFYCFSCCNRAHQHMLRHVVFPDFETRMEIERLLLLRPVNDVRGQTDMERAGMATAILYISQGRKKLPLTRSWDAHETLDDLHRQQDQALSMWSNAGEPRDAELVFSGGE
jgi:hypothetical protein